MKNSIKYLNQFLPPTFQIQYNTFDMARMNWQKNTNVMAKLATIANNLVSKTGIFLNKKPYFNQNSNTIIGQNEKFFKLQTGIIRTNCVDCLDRTNTAQFAIGKCALG